MALQARLSERWGIDVELLWSDDGIVVRLPEAIDELPIADLLIDPEEIDELVIRQLPNTALFASRFRECAARALLLPRRRPDKRTPLWQQRQKAADLLSVAGNHPTFPILLEATRECINDVFDVPALRTVLADLRSRAIRVVPVDTPALAVRAVAGVLVDRRLHVRGRFADRRAAGRRPLAGSRSACATCSAPKSCASCSTLARWPTSSSSCSIWSTAGAPATPTSCTTCCACSAR